jgi:methionine aminopeptidase
MQEKSRSVIRVDQIRQAIADYMNSEGCSCCENTEAHHVHKERIARLLKVPKYKDGSGYDFSRFR